MTQAEDLVTELRLTLARMEGQLENILKEATKTNGRINNLEEKAEELALFRMQVLTIAWAAGGVGTAIIVAVKLVEIVAKLLR